MMRRIYALTAVLLLTACGGGGGGGDPLAGMPGTPLEPPAGMPGTPSEPPFGETVPANTAEFLAAAGPSLHRVVPTSKVWFGSASISAGPDVTAISSSFDGQNVIVTIDRGSAGAITLDDDFRIPYPSVLNLPGRTSGDYHPYVRTSNSAISSLIVVDWVNDDPTDYVAGGYWVYAGPDSTDWEVGGFVVGPELSLSDPPTLPGAGTATYTGEAGGVFAINIDGQETTERFSTDSRLTANFSAGTIAGCIGCGSGIVGDVGSLDLGRVAFDRSNGTFQGSNTTVSTTAVPITQSSGKWAGQFSNVPDSSGAPRMVAGTFDGTASNDAGDTFAIVGAFGAGHQ